jgi:hypothetical protein
LSIAQAKRDDGINKGNPVYWTPDNKNYWYIGICNFCDNPILFLNEGEVFYPNQLPTETDIRIPTHIRKDLIEAKICNVANAHRACAVMARRVLQNACIDMGAKEDKLVNQIRELKQKGKITDEVANWATLVRLVGNDAAHPNKDSVNKEDADDILSLTEELMKILYVTPAIAKERMEIRNKKTDIK